MSYSTLWASGWMVQVFKWSRTSSSTSENFRLCTLSTHSVSSTISLTHLYYCITTASS